MVRTRRRVTWKTRFTPISKSSFPGLVKIIIVAPDKRALISLKQEILLFSVILDNSRNTSFIGRENKNSILFFVEKEEKKVFLPFKRKKFDIRCILF
jgi:hypothetical protein